MVYKRRKEKRKKRRKEEKKMKRMTCDFYGFRSGKCKAKIGEDNHNKKIKNSEKLVASFNLIFNTPVLFYGQSSLGGLLFIIFFKR